MPGKDRQPRKSLTSDKSANKGGRTNRCIKQKRIKTSSELDASVIEYEDTKNGKELVECRLRGKYRASQDDPDNSADNIAFIDNNCSDLSVSNQGSTAKPLDRSQLEADNGIVPGLGSNDEGSPPLSNASPEVRRSKARDPRNPNFLYQTRKSLDSSHFKSQYKNNAAESKDDSQVNLFPKVLAPSIEFSNIKMSLHPHSPSLKADKDGKKSAYMDIFATAQQGGGRVNHETVANGTEPDYKPPNGKDRAKVEGKVLDYEIVSQGPGMYHIALDGSLQSETTVRIVFSQLKQQNAFLLAEIEEYKGEIRELEQINESLKNELGEKENYEKYLKGLYSDKRSLEQLRSAELNKMKAEIERLTKGIDENNGKLMDHLNASNETIQRLVFQLKSYETEIKDLIEKTESAALVEQTAKKRLHGLEADYSDLSDSYGKLREAKEEQERYVEYLKSEFANNQRREEAMQTELENRESTIAELKSELARFKELISRQNMRFVEHDNQHDEVEILESKIETLTREKNELFAQLNGQQAVIDRPRDAEVKAMDVELPHAQQFVSKVSFDRGVQVLRADLPGRSFATQSAQCDIQTEAYTTALKLIVDSSDAQELAGFYEINEVLAKLQPDGRICDVAGHIDSYLVPLVAKLMAKVVHLHQQELSLGEEFKAASEKNSSLNERVDKLIKHMEEKRREIELLEQKVEEKEKKIVSLRHANEARVTPRKQKAKLAVQNTLSIGFRAKSNSGAGPELDRSAILSLQQDLEAGKAQIRTLNETIKAKDANLLSLADDVKSREESIAGLTNTIKALESRLEKAISERRGLQSAVEQYESKLQGYTEKIKSLKLKRDEQNVLIQKKSAEYKKLLQDLKSKIESTVNTSNIATDNKCLEDMNRALQLKLKVLGDEVNRLKKELGKSQTQLFLFETLAPDDTMALFKRFMVKIAYSHEMMKEIRDSQEFVLFHNNINGL